MQKITKLVYSFSKDHEPVATVKSGEVLQFATQDCFGGQVNSEEQLVHEIDFNYANPAAGPVYVESAVPGDVLAVDILDIQVAEKGFACSMGEMGPLHAQSEVRTRLIEVVDGFATYNDIKWPVRPMVGVIGTAPSGDDVLCGFAGSHGGNMDSKEIVKGTRLYFPVRVDGALFQLGDLHASMGDGEISGTGVEICGDVLVRLSLIKGFKLNWPVCETQDTWFVNTTAETYDDALILAADELARLMRPVYEWDTTDIFIYLSIQGNVGINQSTRPAPSDMFTLRLGIPKASEKKPLIK